MATTITETRRPPTTRNYGIWLLVLASLVALGLTVYNFFDMANGIHGTEGALLVVISTALMLVASLVIAAGWARPRWFHVLLEVLIILDIIGTTIAGYLLESWVLVALMAIALIGWILHVILPSPRRSVA